MRRLGAREMNSPRITQLGGARQDQGRLFQPREISAPKCTLSLSSAPCKKL